MCHAFNVAQYALMGVGILALALVGMVALAVCIVVRRHDGSEGGRGF